MCFLDLSFKLSYQPQRKTVSSTSVSLLVLSHVYQYTQIHSLIALVKKSYKYVVF